MPCKEREALLKLLDSKKASGNYLFNVYDNQVVATIVHTTDFQAGHPNAHLENYYDI